MAQTIERLLEFVSPLLGGVFGVAEVPGAIALKGKLVHDRDKKWVEATNDPGGTAVPGGSRCPALR